jgi:hypothetical protein
MHPKLAQNSKDYRLKGFVVIRVAESNEINKLKKILVRHISEKIFRKKIAASRINEHMYHLTDLVEKLHQKKMTASNRNFKRMPAILKGIIKKNVPKFEKIKEAKKNICCTEFDAANFYEKKRFFSKRSRFFFQLFFYFDTYQCQ